MRRRKPIPAAILFVYSVYLFSGYCWADTITRLVAVSDPARGETLAATCLACHTITKNGGNGIGPNLYNAVGREVASAKDFTYSQAMSSTQGHWDLGSLDNFLKEPGKAVPGTAMMYPGMPSPSDRGDLLAWLRLQSDNPLPLPTVSPSEKANLLPTAPTENPDLALLPEGRGREEVFAICSVCHSIKLVVQQGLDRDSWKETLDWMVEEQAMNKLDGDTENLVLDYLSEHFGIDR